MFESLSVSRPDHVETPPLNSVALQSPSAPSQRVDAPISGKVYLVEFRELVKSIAIGTPFKMANGRAVHVANVISDLGRSIQAAERIPYLREREAEAVKTLLAKGSAAPELSGTVLGAVLTLGPSLVNSYLSGLPRVTERQRRGLEHESSLLRRFFELAASQGWMPTEAAATISNPARVAVDWSRFTMCSSWVAALADEAHPRSPSYALNRASVVHTFIETVAKSIKLKLDATVENAAWERCKGSEGRVEPGSAKTSALEAILSDPHRRVLEYVRAASHGSAQREVALRSLLRSFIGHLQTEFPRAFDVATSKRLGLGREKEPPRLPVFERYVAERFAEASRRTVRKDLRVALRYAIKLSEQPFDPAQEAARSSLRELARSGPATAALLRDPLDFLRRFERRLSRAEKISPDRAHDLILALRAFYRWGAGAGIVRKGLFPEIPAQREVASRPKGPAKRTTSRKVPKKPLHEPRVNGSSRIAPKKTRSKPAVKERSSTRERTVKSRVIAKSRPGQGTAKAASKPVARAPRQPISSASAAARTVKPVAVVPTQVKIPQPVRPTVSRAEVLGGQKVLLRSLFESWRTEGIGMAFGLGDVLRATLGDFDPDKGVLLCQASGASVSWRVPKPLLPALKAHIARLDASQFATEGRARRDAPLFVDSRGGEFRDSGVREVDRELDPRVVTVGFNLLGDFLLAAPTGAGVRVLKLEELAAVDLKDVSIPGGTVVVRDLSDEALVKLELPDRASIRLRGYCEVVRTSKVGALWENHNPVRPLFMDVSGQPLIDQF